MLYPAFVEIDTDGTASGFFPDVPGCYFAGDTPEETIADATSALNAHFELLAEKAMAIPEPALTWRSASYPIVDGRAVEGVWVYISIDITRFFGRSERINISMPNLLIEKIDRTVSEDPRYTSRSHFLAEAARKVLSQC